MVRKGYGLMHCLSPLPRPLLSCLLLTSKHPSQQLPQYPYPQSPTLYLPLHPDLHPVPQLLPLLSLRPLTYNPFPESCQIPQCRSMPFLRQFENSLHLFKKHRSSYGEVQERPQANIPTR